jgi:SAM-dependent methyltransferase
LALSTGAEVAGIDAAEELVDVAHLRNPDADIRLGSMFELPWDDQSFDVVISINGIWGGNQAALDEAHRVLEPGGGIGISFWGTGPPLDLRPTFKVFVGHSPEAHVGGMRDVNNIAFEGVAERMLTEAGFVDLERGSRIAVCEWPDPETAWRAITSIGPVVPALEHTDHEVLKKEVLEAIDGCRDRRGVYRFRNDHQFVTGRKP